MKNLKNLGKKVGNIGKKGKKDATEPEVEALVVDETQESKEEGLSPRPETVQEPTSPKPKSKNIVTSIFNKVTAPLHQHKEKEPEDPEHKEGPLSPTPISPRKSSKKNFVTNLFDKVTHLGHKEKHADEVVSPRPDEEKKEDVVVSATPIAIEEKEPVEEVVIPEKKGFVKDLFGKVTAPLSGKRQSKVESTEDKSENPEAPVEEEKKSKGFPGLGGVTSLISKSTEVGGKVLAPVTLTVGKVSETVTKVTDKIDDAIDKPREDLKKMATSVTDKVGEVVKQVVDKIEDLVQMPKYDDQKFFGVINDITGIIPTIEENINSIMKALAPEAVIGVLKKLIKLVKEIPLDQLREMPGKIVEIVKEFKQFLVNKDYLPKSRVPCLEPLILYGINKEMIKGKFKDFYRKFEEVGKALFAGIPFELIEAIIDFFKSFSEQTLAVCTDAFNNFMDVLKKARKNIADILNAVNILNKLKTPPESLGDVRDKAKEMSQDLKDALMNTKSLLMDFGKTTADVVKFEKFDFSALKKVFSRIGDFAKMFTREKIDQCIEKIKDVVFFIMKAQDDLNRILKLATNGCMIVVFRCLIVFPDFLEKAYRLLLDFKKLVDLDELKNVFGEVTAVFTDNQLLNTDYNAMFNKLLNALFDRVRALNKNFSVVQDQVTGLVRVIKPV